MSEDQQRVTQLRMTAEEGLKALGFRHLNSLKSTLRQEHPLLAAVRGLEVRRTEGHFHLAYKKLEWVGGLAPTEEADRVRTTLRRWFMEELSTSLDFYGLFLALDGRQNSLYWLRATEVAPGQEDTSYPYRDASSETPPAYV